MEIDRIIEILKNRNEYDNSELNEAIIFAIAELKSLEELRKMGE